MKKHAFTLIEITVVLIIIGFFSIIMVKNLKQPNDDMNNKIIKTKLLKAVNAVQTACQQIKEFEKVRCPMQTFIVNAAGTYEYALVNSSGNSADTDEVLSIFSDYIKFQESPLNFCDYTEYCNDNDIKGGKIIGDIYIGFKAYGNDITDCPNYKLPDSDDEISGSGKCWGNLYIKLAGNSGEDEYGKTVFVFGLNEFGVVY